jgi:hypothetical protein
MQDPRLRQLNNRTVAVELTILNRRTILRGMGRFEADGEFGPALHVAVSDASGEYEFIVKEQEWDGRIQPGERFECDFALQLDASCLCAS